MAATWGFINQNKHQTRRAACTGSHGFTQVHTGHSPYSETHLAGAAVHWPQILGELFSDDEVHVEVPECGEGADLHGARVRVVGDLFGGLQQAHDLPQGKIDV